MPEPFSLEKIYIEAESFRLAIIDVLDSEGFPDYQHHRDRMNGFPAGCCDDTSDLFAHYLYSRFNKCSERVDGTCFGRINGYRFNHSWLVVDGLIVDLTGDQFCDDPVLEYKTNKIYVGPVNDFYKQFDIENRMCSCGIHSLAETSWERMYSLYELIIKHMKNT